MIDAELLPEIEPAAEKAYQEHMQSIGHERPFSPGQHLAELASRDKKSLVTVDPLEYGPILRDDYETHIEDFGSTYGVNVRPILAASFLVNLLTEDNLPHYTSRIQAMARDSSALGAFANEWTAEEDAHGVIMRDYALLTGLIGERSLSVLTNAEYHAGRISQLRAGTEINPTNLLNGFAYLTLQELLTKEAHGKMRWLLPTMGRKAMNPVIGDEQNHYEFYRKMSEAALAIDPDGTLRAMQAVYEAFSMPGALGIPNFGEHSKTIALAGIFDAESVARAQQTIIQKLNIANAQPTTDAGKAAQEALLKMASKEFIARKQKLMEKIRDRAQVDEKDELRPFILGRTIKFDTIDTRIGLRIKGLQPINA